MRQRAAIDEVCAALAGGWPPNGEAGDAVVALAARAWVPGALQSALVRSQGLDRLSDDARGYLALLSARSRERALRQRAQLWEALGQLDQAGLTPLLVKGAAILAQASEEAIGARLMCDLDLVVAPGDTQRALPALRAAGYERVAGVDGLVKSGMPGVLELHEPRGGDPLHPVALQSERRLIETGGYRAWVPTAIAHAHAVVVHDMIKDGDWWRGTIDLRHLIDLADFDRREPIDWNRLRALMPDPRSRAAVETQALVLEELMGRRPTGLSHVSPAGRMQAARCLIQARGGAVGRLFGWAGALAWTFARVRAGDLPGPFEGSFWRRAIRKAIDGPGALVAAMGAIHAGPKI